MQNFSPGFYLRERLAPAGVSRLGGFLSLMAVTVPSRISSSPSHEGHLRRDLRMTVCIDV